LIGAGRLAEAADAVRRLTELAKRSPALRTTAAWLRGWLAERRGEHDNARLEYESALAATAGPDDIALDRARVAHAYGLLLLTRGNRRLAITQLRQAFDAYSRLGAQPFLERCAADLADTGLRVSAGQSAGPLAVLSAKEHQVAHLVAAGLTNQQVAKEIYISVKTVEFHLGNIFTKLGITSRKDVGTLIADHTEDVTPAQRGPGTDQRNANSSISLIATSGGLPPE
jgi:DNA-binding CsgD family transcriptional regulator